jgi:amino acid transporter
MILRRGHMSQINTKMHSLTIFSLVLITVGSVDSIRNLPGTALFGSQLVAFFILGAIFFLIPTALVSAELSSSEGMGGGIYVWVKKAFGKRIGFFAIWLQWIENVIWYPALLSFVAGSIGYLINPHWVDSPMFLWAVIVSSFWGATWVNLCGMRSSAFFSNLCAISGLLLPMSLIIGLGSVWIWQGNPRHIFFDIQSLTPHFQDKNMWVSLTATMLSFCGVEIATVHANEVANPQKAFPKALLIAVAIILMTLILGSLAIAVVLPENEINLVAGIMQTFHAIFMHYHLLWMMPLVALMLVMGGLGSVSNWIIAPTKGLWIAAQDDHLPVSFQRVNRHNAPVVLLVGQAVVVTILSSLFFFMPSVNSSYWLLTALATILYMMMYLLMFAAAIKLRWKNTKQTRAFQIPGGIIGMCVTGLIGIVGVSVTFAVSFIPPEGLMNIGSVARYESLLVVGLLVMCLPPFLAIYRTKFSRSGLLARQITSQ